VSAHSEAPQQVATAWAQLPDGIDDVRPGEVAAPRRVSLMGERLGRVAAAIRSVLGETDAPVSIADICPDPLVFALESGLPRLTSFGRSIDGGSQWRDLAQMDAGPLFAVSAIAEVAARSTADRRRLIRVAYLTQFTSERGVLVGTATGTSLHVGSVG
jgi:hypothetical protein